MRIGEARKELGTTLRLAGPIVAGNIGQILIGVVDTLMIAKLGVVELGAAAFVNNIFVLPLLAVMGLLAAVPVLVSQAKGASNSRLVGRHMKHSLLVTLVISFVVWGALGVNAGFLDSYGQEQEVVEASRGYYWLIIATLLPGLIYQCLKCVSEGLGWSNPPMVALLLGISLNILLNWILIFGELGAPALGLKGAGWATLISRWLIVVGLLIYIAWSPRFREYLPMTWIRRYEWRGFASILKLGLPTSAQHVFEVGAFSGAGIMIGWISAEALAAHQVALSCAAMAFMIPLGVSIGSSIRVGEAYGSEAYGKIEIIGVGTIGFTVLQTTFTALCFLLFGKWMAGLFVGDEVVVGIAASIFVVVGLFQIFDGVQVVSIGALRGMSDVNIPMGFTFTAYWIFALPVGYWLGFSREFGVVGVWCGLAAGLCLAAILLTTRLFVLVKKLRNLA